MKTVLVANRGEIACRVMRSCRSLGLRTVAVYSEADRQSMHVQSADAAVAIGPSSPRESYLNMERLIAAAQASMRVSALSRSCGRQSRVADRPRVSTKWPA